MDCCIVSSCIWPLRILGLHLDRELCFPLEREPGFDSRSLSGCAFYFQPATQGLGIILHG